MLRRRPLRRVFLATGVKAPLGIGDVLLEDQTVVKGFIGEGYGVVDAEDITHFGGWRAYVQHVSNNSRKL